MSQWDDRLREILKHATPEKRRVWEDSERRRDPSLHRQREWVRQLVELADEIDRRGLDVDWRTLDLFWIRAFGVLRELGDRYTQTVRNLGPERAGEGPLSQWGRILYGTAAEILSPLREEEVIVIDWLRHRAAHVFQRGYGLQLVKGKVKERRGIELLGRKIDCSIDETDAARASVLREYHHDETAMQLALARKMLPGLRTFAHFHKASLAS